jgi:hypothetical protein
VLSSDRKIGGFFGATSGPMIEKKRNLLLGEGVKFVGGEADEERCFSDFDVETLTDANIQTAVESWKQ